MKKLLFKRILFASISFLAPSVYAAISPADLVKVTAETTTQCVEYYNYHGAMYCSIKPLSTEAVDPAIKDYETQDIVFDNRAWQAAWGKKSDEITMIEYVPMGDSINNWHELVTSQFFPGIQNDASPKEFANGVIKGFQDSGFKPIVTFIKETPDHVIFEFRIEEPQAQIQDELQIITKGDDGFYVVHYVIKEKDMGKQSRDQWIKNLSSSTIK